jgi:hypothetical protein
MSERTKRPTPPSVVARPGPVEPGTPLYRALELIAAAVAKTLETDSRPKSKRHKER